MNELYPYGRICDACSGILNNKVENGRVYLHHRNFISFAEAKRSGCHLCNQIWDRLISHCNTTALLEPESSTFRTIWVRNRYLKTSWIELSMGSRSSFGSSDVNLYLQSFKDETIDLEHREIRSSSDSNETRALIQRWLHNCDTIHRDCYHTTGMVELPDRVIDVGSRGAEFVVLRFRKDLSPDRYLTLSHRWGAIEMPKLTRDTVESLTAGFPISALPKTFRDAIDITRYLKIKYLWIDSLCIFQDSEEDWRQQAAAVGPIYRNCYCNLAATGAADCNDGLFYEREPFMVRPLLLSPNDMHESSHGSNTELSTLRYRVFDLQAFQENVERSELNTRGWVFQERLLSPRILHFGRTQVVWECHKIRASETYPDRVPTGPLDMLLWNYFWVGRTFIHKLATKLMNDRKRDVSNYSDWRLLVSTYSTLNLTKPEDRLVALSGLAEMMEHAQGDEYLAGLWKKDLAHGLLWERRRRDTSSQATPRPKWVAPSWSWASLSTEILWEDRVDFAVHEHIKLLKRMVVGGDASSNLASSDIRLFLEGRVLPALHHPWTWDIVTSVRQIALEVFEENYVGWISLDDPVAHSNFENDHKFPHTLPLQLKILPVLYSDRQDDDLRPHLYCLLVSDTGEPEHFQRLGRLDLEINPDQLAGLLKRADAEGGIGKRQIVVLR